MPSSAGKKKRGPAGQEPAVADSPGTARAVGIGQDRADRYACGDLFFFPDAATTEIYTLSLHDALPISTAPRASPGRCASGSPRPPTGPRSTGSSRSEEHTSELQSRVDLVCRLLLE